MHCRSVLITSATMPNPLSRGCVAPSESATLVLSLCNNAGLNIKEYMKHNSRDIRDNGVLSAILGLSIAAAGVILLLAYFDVLIK